MAGTYLFLNYNCIFAYEISLSDRWGVLAKDFILCSIYRSNQPSRKFTALHKLISILLQLTKSCGVRAISKNYSGDEFVILPLCQNLLFDVMRRSFLSENCKLYKPNSQWPMFPKNKSH